MNTQDNFMKTLIILDVQNDFMPSGSLGVPNGDAIVPVINSILHCFDLIVASQDWHPSNHTSFASNHTGRKPFEKIKLGNLEQTLWPDHCVQGSIGAQFHAQLNTNPIEAIFRKGTDPNIDSYSGFYDNLHKKTTGLAGYLHEKGARELYFCGLCADICVYFTIKDALSQGFDCYLIEDATQALVKDDFIRIKKELIKQGTHIINSSNLLNNLQ
ncbi:TPA: bifunctional nicotinamidase/pyrazinamidase [Legionella pneumophila subsp. pneumophila]|nr:bifunctional nicotinamidase/pyrazinamidase [Legionella pneumophila]HAT9353354.1 bifunctional nicotinamidase/pyrazinamidase [Legionella pneumophila subsp. pneumophila]HAT9368458.1 bifunctional nicotinamidase/pyrazinamidase [Legionella pneumophila subsp. pneumophila]HAT9692909.1 bifunctional nicotinamidase/pyrazinamidase [Legionella pneumophila subsp. pneumophila]HAT9829272.1 bifunctional nicotinamidase/pyrazinamidase [Legionella pneumophila subsp. pneumophila]